MVMLLKHFYQVIRRMQGIEGRAGSLIYPHVAMVPLLQPITNPAAKVTSTVGSNCLLTESRWISGHFWMSNWRYAVRRTYVPKIYTFIRIKVRFCPIRGSLHSP